MKPMPASAMQRAMASAPISILTPSAASTSAAPERDDSARLPCLATGTPAPATINAAQVEMLNEPEASPPVPTTSMASAGAATRSILARMTVTAPVISSTVSPRTRSAISKAPICEGVASPPIICSKALAASSRVSEAPVATLPIKARNESVTTGPSIRRRPQPAGRGTRLRGLVPPPARGVPCRGDVEEVPQDEVAVLGGDALGGELNAVCRQPLVRKSHDQAIVGFGCHRQRRRQALTLDHERMVACGLERRVKAMEKAAAVVANGRELAVHRLGRPHHPAAESFADRLVAEADAEEGDFAGNRGDQIEADAGVLRGAGTGRKDNSVGIGGDNGGARNPVVAMHAHRGTQFPEIMHEVEGEAVVVVDQDDHRPALLTA